MKLDIKKLPLYFAIAVLLSVVLFYVLIGISFWLLFILTIWGLFYLVFIVEKIKLSFVKDTWAWWIFFVIVAICLVLLVFFKLPGRTSTKSVQKPLTKDQCAPIKEKYNNKTVSFTSDGLEGRASVRITDENTCKSEIVFQYIFEANLAENDIPGNSYMGYTTEKDSEENRKYWGGNGSITSIYNGRRTLPDNPFEISAPGIYGNQGESASRFYAGYSEEPYLTEDRYKKIIEENKIWVIDGRKFITEEKDASGIITTTVDDTVAARQGKIVKVFNLKFSE